MKKQVIYYSLLVVFLFAFIFSAINLTKQSKDLNKKIKLNKEYQSFANNFYNSINVLDEYRNYYNNQDIKAIIEIDSLEISSLVVQGQDNNYYLNHLENKETSRYGSLMLDYRTNLDNSKINIIYGHMSNSEATPFKQLEKYLNEEFYENNPYIEIITDNNTYKYEIFSVANINKTSDKHLLVEFSNNKQYLDHYNWLKSISKFNKDITLLENDQILILQTCSSTNSKEFLLIISRKVSD